MAQQYLGQLTTVALDYPPLICQLTNSKNEQPIPEDQLSSCFCWIHDFINGRYQGHLSTIDQLPRGPGIVIDDEFNFIVASDWQSGQVNGKVFIKLVNQIMIWGQWRLGAPGGVNGVQIGDYVILMPFAHQVEDVSHRDQVDIDFDNNRYSKTFSEGSKPERCIIYHQKRKRAYITLLEPKPHNNPQRQYKILIERVICCRKNPIKILNQIAKNLGYPYQLQQNLLIPHLYLQQVLQKQSQIITLNTEHYSSNLPHDKDQFNNEKYLFISLDQRHLLSLQHNASNLFIMNLQISNSIRSNHPPHKSNSRLGLLVYRKSLQIKSVGVFKYNDYYQLNGQGLIKNVDSKTLIGVFKNDMLVKQFSNVNHSFPNSAAYRKENTAALKSLICSNAIRFKLSQDHMKSFLYIQNSLYYPQVKRIVKLSIELHKYIEMFERLSENKKGLVDSSQIDSQQTEEQLSSMRNKYVVGNHLNLRKKPKLSNIDTYQHQRNNHKQTDQSSDNGDYKDIQPRSSSKEMIVNQVKQLPVSNRFLLPKQLYYQSHQNELEQYGGFQSPQRTSKNRIRHVKEQQRNEKYNPHQTKKPGFIVYRPSKESHSKSPINLHRYKQQQLTMKNRDEQTHRMRGNAGGNKSYINQFISNEKKGQSRSKSKSSSTARKLWRI